MHATALDPSEASSRRAELDIVIESEPAGVGVTPAPLSSFSDCGSLFPSWLTDAFTENKWDKPMPVQAQSLPILLSGRNLIGIAQTGSGKTGAFLIPAIVHCLDQQPLRRTEQGPIVLVISPTRELAVQISDEAEKMLKHSSRCREHHGGIRSAVFYGGGRKGDQLKKFTFDGSHICVATPGRLIDFCTARQVSLRRVTYLCLDEADRMLDMGFSGDMQQIGAAVRPERQTVFFSATWPKEVQSLATSMCTDGQAPVLIRVGAKSAEGGEGGLQARAGITQRVVVVDFPEEAKPWIKQEEEKRRLLDLHIKEVLAQEGTKMIIFVNQKTMADEVSTKMWDEGIPADAIHGGRPQESRLWILEKFRRGELRLLIATDVIGRGLDIPQVSHVVVYTMGGVEDYIHRIGRTGRGKDGIGQALVFFEYAGTQPDTAKELISVLQKSNQHVPQELVQIALDVAAGKRWSRNASNAGGGGWGNGSWGNSSWGAKKEWK